MRKNNIWRIIWVVGIYAILILILMLVINYKVKWENKDLNTYLYFYNCSDELCSTTVPQMNYYSKIVCDDDICPYIKEKKDNLLILSNENKEWIYDYKNDKLINDSYKKYIFTNDCFIVTDGVGKQGVINLTGDILVDLQYDLIKDYNNDFVVYNEDNKYGIINNKKNISIDANYDDVILINDDLYAYLNNGKYSIAKYVNNEIIVENKYDYLYSDGNVIFVINDKKIDILDMNLKSLLLLRIDTYYGYTKEQERDTLKINVLDNFMFFDVVYNDASKKYIFDIKNKKLV